MTEKPLKVKEGSIIMESEILELKKEQARLQIKREYCLEKAINSNIVHDSVDQLIYTANKLYKYLYEDYISINVVEKDHETET